MRFLFWLALISLFIWNTALATEPPLFKHLVQKEADLYLFHSEDCDKCRTALPGIVSLLNSMYPHIQVKALELKDPKNYELLKSFETKLGRRAEELPVAVIGKHLLAGEEIENKLDSVLLELSFSPAPPVPIDDKPIEPKPPGPGKIQANVVYFYRNGCARCGRTDLILHHLTQKYPYLTLERIDLSTTEGIQQNEAITRKLNLPEKYRLLAPSLIIGKHFLSGKDLTDENVEKILLASQTDVESSVLAPPSEEELNQARDSILARFESLSAIPVALAGLIDGFNPCAFATLIFLISFLTMSGRDKKEILKIGLGFTAAVFLTYLLIGLGVFSFVRQISFLPDLAKWVYLFTGVFAIAIGILSFYDYLLWKKGREKEMKLQLPTFLKRVIHRSIRSIDFKEYYLPGACFLGFSVSIFEFTCTGQVYLPTILFVMGTSLKEDAFLYLVLYNLSFVTPLIGVFGLFYTGTTQERFASFLKKRGSLIKFLTGGILLFIGGVMLMEVL